MPVTRTTVPPRLCINPRRLALSGGLLLMLPGLAGVCFAEEGEPEPVNVTGVVRDFRTTHRDFDIDIPCVLCFGHFAGLVQTELGANGRPVLFDTHGRKIMDQWRDEEGRPIAPHLFGVEYGCSSVNDTPGTTGVDPGGSISSAESFAEWFDDLPGTNLSLPLTLRLEQDARGVYSYENEEFYPVDGQGFGNEGEDHNANFTFALRVHFIYEECEDQFIEFRGGDGAWFFVGEQLVLDLGGVITHTEQYVELDRLGLEDGRAYDMDIFYAQRERARSHFVLRTNVKLLPDEENPMVSASFD